MKDSQKMKENKKQMAHKVGDTIEKVGKKAAEMGATETGAKIYKYGNKVEHSRDKK